jgi:hypothetical protein
MFGDAPWPCSKGDGANTDSGNEPGVTKDAISIAGGDDAGWFAGGGGGGGLSAMDGADGEVCGDGTGCAEPGVAVDGAADGVGGSGAEAVGVDGDLCREVLKLKRDEED